MIWYFGTAFIVGLFILSCVAAWLTRRDKAKSLNNLSGKHVLVTGGSSGIGKAVAIEAVKRGAHVSIVARDEKKLVQADLEIRHHCKWPSQKTAFASIDVCGPADLLSQAVDKLTSSLGPITVLVNCAGFSVASRAEQMQEADLRRMMDVNFFGSVNVTRKVLPDMKAAGEGVLIFTSSLAGLTGVYGLSAYCATKFAVRGYAEALAMEVAPFGIKVSVSCPPDTDTPGFAEEEKTKPEETKLIAQAAGLFQPAEVARTLLDDGLDGKFLSSNGLDGWMLTTLGAGMSPSSFLLLLTHVLLMGPLRLVGWCYLQYFAHIVNQCNKRRNSGKKSN